jgi:hypothetical protein
MLFAEQVLKLGMEVLYVPPTPPIYDYDAGEPEAAL